MSATIKSYTMNSRGNKISYKQSIIYKQFEPDFWLVLNDKIYPTHSKIIQKSKYIEESLNQEQKLLTMPQNISAECFQQVLRFIYCQQISFPRNKAIAQLINASHQLKICQLEKLIYQQIQKNFEEYNLFLMCQIASQYGVQWLTKRCEEQLIYFQFEQLEDDKQTLLQLNLQLFTNLITTHQKLKQKKQIIGLKNTQILQIIEDYENFNKCKVDLGQITITQQNFCHYQENILKQNINKVLSTLTCSHSHSHQNSFNCLNFDTRMQDVVQIQIQNQNQKQVQIQRQRQVQIHNNEVLKNNYQIYHKIMGYDFVNTPVISFDEFQHKDGFQQLSTQQTDKFMDIDKQGHISQKDSDQEQDDLSEMNQQYQNSKKKQYRSLQGKVLLKSIPSFSKHFVI